MFFYINLPKKSNYRAHAIWKNDITTNVANNWSYFLHVFIGLVLDNNYNLCAYAISPALNDTYQIGFAVVNRMKRKIDLTLWRPSRYDILRSNRLFSHHENIQNETQNRLLKTHKIFYSKHRLFYFLVFREIGFCWNPSWDVLTR